ncbi:MAG TPA: CzcE family metal-binding protein [Burkholderiales bacterium]|nr:CzcE family metal-binding protein [Burkholderiales bacterium]HUK05370.1 CzcE family metal-binding protein [Burkholderiales bacterium]
MKVFAPAFAALALSAASVSSFALTNGDLYGQPAASDYAADRTIVVTPETKFINVNHGEVVKLKVGSQEFTWNFDGMTRPFDLREIAPEGALDHDVRVYVETTGPVDGGFGD